MSVVVSNCGELALLQAAIDRIWTDPIQKTDFEASAEAAKAVLANQRVKFSELQGQKDRILSVEWLNNCEVSTQECSDDCEIDGLDVQPECKEYRIACLQETAFKVGDRVYRDQFYDKTEAVATNMLNHMKALDEWIAQYIVSGLEFFSGVNQYTGGIGDVQGQDTIINPQHWDDQIWGYFNRVIRGNKFKNPYVITGDNLYQLLFNRFHERENADGKGNFNKMGAIGSIWQDPENVEVIAPKATYLIHGGAVAFVSKAWNPVGAANAVQKAGQYYLWSEPSRHLDGVWYDIIKKEACEENDFTDAYKIQLHGLFAMNPFGCNDDITGVLSMICDS